MNHRLAGAWLALGMVLSLLLCRHAQGQASPLADDFAGATLIVGVTNVTGSTEQASAQAGEPAHYGEPARSSIWANWTAPQTGTYSVTTSNSTFDTVLAVYLGSALNNLKAVITNDDIDFRTFTSELRFRAYVGETFRIAVDGVGGARGRVQLNVSLGGPVMSNWTTLDPHGGLVSSSDFTQRVLLVDFWETTCGACVDELPDLVRLQRALAPSGFSILGLSIDPVVEEVVRFLNIHDEVNYPMAMSSANAAASLLGGALGAPTKYLVDQDRRIVARYLGGHDPLSETYAYYMGQLLPLLRSSSIVRLTIERQADSVRVSWPQGDPGDRLEASSTTLTGWNAISGMRQTNSGRIIVTLPSDGSSRFYRLAKP